eukprot:TRINITY_DN102206_c0_g1_i1.p1 TRINITY_DN102206_c0_g1~~TRINITY_DN102206_c0_g1_i1.p1  ORF type:complete len:176 (+),score=20.17 TRINITY_DN102206_c0_g1_i1:82-609(+)
MARYETKRQRELNATRRWCIMAAFTAVAIALWVLIESNSSIKNLNLKTSSQFYNSSQIDQSKDSLNLNQNQNLTKNSNQSINLIIYDDKTKSPTEEFFDGEEQKMLTTKNSSLNSNLNSNLSDDLSYQQLDFNYNKFQVFVENVEGTEVRYEKAIFSSDTEEKFKFEFEFEFKFE